MIDVKALIKGEIDTPPFTRFFQYDDRSENIFFNSVQMIKERLDHNLRININETLVIFCAYIVNELRAGSLPSTISENASKILSVDRVMFGVPESIRKITFEAIVDNKHKEIITFNEPIPTSDYFLAPKE